MSIAVESLTRSLASDTSGCLTAMVLDAENRIYAPKLPLISIIPNGMTAGKSILVKGLITGKHRNNFAINLCCGLLTDGLHRDNIALHVNPRFDSEHKLVLNSLIDDTWGPEERHKNPLRKGQAFMIRITALPDSFKIAFNHDVTIEYLHRVPLSDIKTIQVEGCVIVDAVEYFAAPPTALPFSLSVNYKEALPVLRFTMWVLKSPYRIEMDFLAGDDIAFHSSVRFDEQTIVRNVQRRGKWEAEERLLDIFPFQPSCTYELEIHCLPEHFVVRVGGSHCYNFNHRLRPELIDRFNLKGNARLLKFCLE
ncbi:galactoside binding lectin family protein [Trichuris trichiura]|uniref:Galectin n=1 Tax=Trichuris trichiura TaxID=36087 RepID=A0A077YVV9_TRITR|nr:galactoside binding lectin family protein [Trichuris trichiura]